MITDIKTGDVFKDNFDYFIIGEGTMIGTEMHYAYKIHSHDSLPAKIPSMENEVLQSKKTLISHLASCRYRYVLNMAKFPKISIDRSKEDTLFSFDDL